MKNAKRFLAAALSFALFLALPLAFTQETAAASKTKVTQPSRVFTTYVTYKADGSAATTENTVEAFAYDELGLTTLTAKQDNSGVITEKKRFVYDNNGYMTSATWLNEKDKPYWQDIYSIRKGKIRGISEYALDGAKADLKYYTKITYKSGKVQKIERVTGDLKILKAAAFIKGILSKAAVDDKKDNAQTIAFYDKHGNITSSMYVNGSYAEKTVYKNTYKKGKLVRVDSTTAYSDSKDVINGLTLYTYKNGKLVRKVSAETNPATPGYIEGGTTVYEYTKGGLIKTEIFAHTYTMGADTRVDWSTTTAYQYRNVAVDQKYAKAVKQAMKDYSYEYYLPGNALDEDFYD